MFLSASGVTSGYGGTPVIKDVSVTVGLPEVVLVMGPNGAGKSTLVKTITGELAILGGALTLSGNDITRAREEDRIAAGIGYVPQVRDVFGPLTVQENLEMGGYRLRRQDITERQDEVFGIFPQLGGLRRRQARSLSGGERKMLAIGRALMARPQLLILDEPTANLAPVVAATVLHGIVSSLAAAGRAVLLIEQRVSLALEVATWGYVLSDGALILEASCDTLRDMEDLGTLFLGRGATDLTARVPPGTGRDGHR